MNDTPAIIPAAYVKLSTLVDGTIRVVIDVEPKDRDAAFRLFDSPGAPIAVARLTQQAATAEDQRRQAELVPSAPAEPRKALSIASKVAVACQDPEFHEFLRTDRDGLAMEWSRLAVPGDDKATAERVVKWWCQVERKRDIEADHRSLGRWRDLHREFQNWLGSRALARRTGRAA